MKNQKSTEKLHKTLVEMDVALHKTASTDFRTFVKIIKPDFIFEDWNVTIIEELQNLLFGDTENLMIFAPPRGGKSELSSRLFPAFALGVFSGWTLNGGHNCFEILLGSYSVDLAKEFSASVQTYMDSFAYNRILLIKSGVFVFR